MADFFVTVPAWWIKDKAVDYRGEALQAIGIPITFKGRLCSRLVVPPPAIGAFTVLEALGNDFIRNPYNCTPRDIFEALAAAEMRRNAPELLNPAVNRKATRRLEVLYGREIIRRFDEVVNFFHALPFAGFEKIIGAKTSVREPWLFGAPAVASVVHGVAEACGVSPDYVIWDLPLVLAGHLTASPLPFEKCKRPKDPADIKRQLSLAVDREKKGEVHPWQKMYPEDYPPSRQQISANPHVREDIAAAHAQFLKEKSNSKKGK